jgi:hypothetical protein
MHACLILGDSIALGAAALQALQIAGCDIRARTGASVEMIASMAPTGAYRLIILSAGSNDRLNPQRVRDLERLRTRLSGSEVVWIYPREPLVAWDVYHVARRRGDRTVDITKAGSKDGVHPRDYIVAARMVLAENGPRTIGNHHRSASR